MTLTFKNFKINKILRVITSLPGKIRLRDRPQERKAGGCHQLLWGAPLRGSSGKAGTSQQRALAGGGGIHLRAGREGEAVSLGFLNKRAPTGSLSHANLGRAPVCSHPTLRLRMQSGWAPPTKFPPDAESSRVLMDTSRDPGADTPTGRSKEQTDSCACLVTLMKHEG